MKTLLLVLTFAGSAASAGGMREVAAAPDPCPPGLVADGTVTGEMLAGFVAIRQMSCPQQEPPRRVFFDRTTGEPLDDPEILRRVFNGHSPTAVPLPSSIWLLLGGLVMLSTRKGTRT